MTTDYDTNLSIKNLFEQIDNAVEFATVGGAPYTPEKILTIAF